LLFLLHRNGADTKLFYRQDSTLPVYKWTHCKEHFSVQELGRILLTNTVPQEKLCSIQPTKVCHNTTFVVDLHALDDIDDIRADENGVWIRKGSPIAFLSVHDNGHDGKVKVVRRSRMGSHLHYYKLTRTYYQHSCSPDFHRIITTVHGSYYFLFLMCPASNELVAILIWKLAKRLIR